MIVSITLALVIAVSVPLGIHCYKEYNEEAVFTNEFLPYPDAITVYYKDGAFLRSKRLTDDEIALVFEAFEVLKENICEAKDNSFFHPWSAKSHYWSSHLKKGDVRFHYKQRRWFDYKIKNPGEPDVAYHSLLNGFNLTGEFDSISICNIGDSNMRFVGERNGKHYGNYTYLGFSTEAADIFWETVMSCVE